MDLYSFIKSKAIREYLREINHQFTTLEAVYVVWQAKGVPIQKKHEAWEYIIENMPDCIIGNPEIETWSLHQRLKDFIEVERQELAAFYRVLRASLTKRAMETPSLFLYVAGR